MTWLDEARCPDSAHDFTPTRTLTAREVTQLARICDSCPVAAECLLDALQDPDAAGYRAGTWPADRQRLRTANAITPAERWRPRHYRADY